MPLPRASRARLVWALELSLGLELYACAVLALHARGLKATPLEASPALVLPALVIPPVFYVLVALVSVRPLSLAPALGAVAAMCGLHGLLVAATGALFMIPDLLDYGAAVAFALWGSPAVTLLQLTAAPLVFARLRPLLSSPRAPRAEARPAPALRRVEAPAVAPPPVASKPLTIPPAQPRPAVAPPAMAATAKATPFRSATGGAAVSVASRSQATAPPPAPVASRSTVPPALAAAAPPVVKAATPPGAPPSKRALDWAEPTIRVPFVRIADQLPVEMFVRGLEGLKDTLRPGVSLLVPRKLLLPHLGEGLAPVKWEVVADQFPLDELALTHEEIAERLPDGSLLLPLDEVVPQIPPELLVLSTPPADVHALEDFPAPFQPHTPALEPVVAETARVAAAPPNEIEKAREDVAAPERAVAEAAEAAEAVDIDGVPEVDAADEDEEARPVPSAVEVTTGPAVTTEPVVITAPVVTAAPAVTAAPVPHVEVAAEPGRSEQARRIAARLAPLLNGLEIAQHDGAGTTLVTVVAPTLSEDSVVRTAVRVVPFLTDARLPEPVTQATVTAAGSTLVLTPFGSADAGGALLVTAVASRASLAWLERLSRTAAREAQGEVGNGKRSGLENDSSTGIELQAASVPTAVRELAGSLTAFGPVAPTLLRDRAGLLSACLFLPSSLDALPLARFARDLHAALGSAEIGRVASVILKLGARRVILRSMDGEAGNLTMLVGVGRIDRPGLARIELDRAATRLGALVRG